MHHVKILVCLLAFIFVAGMSYAQEFPIAVGNDDTFSGGGAFDGTNFFMSIQGDIQNHYDLTAQLVSRSGSLTGPRISLGATGSGLIAAFDGINYLVVWTDSFPRFAGGDTNGIGDVYGQFVSTSGNLVGTTFTFVTDVNRKFGQGRGSLTFQDTTYLLTYLKGGVHIDHLYGQRISRSGNLIGSPIQISSGYARECAIAFDGTNYLMAWCKVDQPAVDKDIYGQFISTSGALVGVNFLIDGSPYANDNPVTMTFDGSRYCVAFHEQAADSTGRWNLYARFVSPSGAIAERFMICDSTKSPAYATAAFDGTHYLITWMESVGSVRVRGRFFTASGVPIDTAFTVFDMLEGKFPVGGVGGFVDGHYLLGATRLDANFANGDVYGMFLPASTAGVEKDERGVTPQAFVLSQNYPNPFNPSSTIRYGLPHSAFVTLTIYNVLGQQVAELVNEQQQAGYHNAEFHGDGLASGVYFYRLQAGDFVASKKLILLK